MPANNQELLPRRGKKETASFLEYHMVWIRNILQVLLLTTEFSLEGALSAMTSHFTILCMWVPKCYSRWVWIPNVNRKWRFMSLLLLQILQPVLDQAAQIYARRTRDPGSIIFPGTTPPRELVPAWLCVFKSLSSPAPSLHIFFEVTLDLEVEYSRLVWHSM